MPLSLRYLNRASTTTGILALWAVGCVGGNAPADPYDLGGSHPIIGAAGDGGSGAIPDAGSRESHFPLVDGTSWSFHHQDGVTPEWDETDTMTAGSYQGKPAFVLSDQEDEQGEQTHSTHIVSGTQVLRAYKEIEVKGEVVETTTYDPAFVRYDESWTQIGQSVTLDDDWTRECVMASTACSSAGTIKPGTTTHKYTVLDMAAKVTVPAGTFTTVKIQRDNLTSPETKIFWFAAGVGKVREETPASGATTELTAYEIP